MCPKVTDEAIARSETLTMKGKPVGGVWFSVFGCLWLRFFIADKVCYWATLPVPHSKFGKIFLKLDMERPIVRRKTLK